MAQAIALLAALARLVTIAEIFVRRAQYMPIWVTVGPGRVVAARGRRPMCANGVVQVQRAPSPLTFLSSLLAAEDVRRPVCSHEHLCA
jgi:hypothetical protein